MLLGAMLIATTAADPQPEQVRVRIEEIIVSGDGTAGELFVSPEFMGGKPRVYAFGGSVCRSYPLTSMLVEQLFGAMKIGALIEVRSAKVKETDCIASIGFFARTP